MKYKDYYEILGVERTATPDEIKKAYRRLARKYHPDVSQAKDAEERFKEVSEAYEVLKDPDKRASYDQLGHNWKAGQEFRTPPGWDGSPFGGAGAGGFGTGDFSDFFESLFGGGAWGSGRSGRRSTRGQDQHAHLRISLEDAYRGADKTVNVSVPVADGYGHQSTDSRKLRVKIPAGITSGSKIRLAGQGAPASSRSGAGDLYLEIEIASHSWFELNGKDITLTLPITPWEAALGGSVAVPTLGGTVDLKIPEGVKSGQKMRLKGRGLPGTPAGDQFVVLQVVVPKPSNSEERRLYEELAKCSNHNPRKHLS